MAESQEPERPEDGRTGTHVLARRQQRHPAPAPASAAPDPGAPVSLVRPAAPAARRGVSLDRAQAPTELRPSPKPGPEPDVATRNVGRSGAAGGAPAASHAAAPAALPPGELLGTAVPSRPRRGRRTGLLAGAVAVVAGMAVAVVVLANPGSGGDGGAASGTSSTVSAGASADGSGTAPAASGPAPATSSTVAGTARPESLPPGAHREAGGYAWATPAGWRRDVKTGAEVHYTSPDGKQELVAKSALARGDLLTSWQTSEQNAHQGTGYRKIRLEETTFRGHPAVVWEYTFTLQGVPWHARLLGFDAKGTSFQVNTWYQPDVEDRAVRTYHRVRDSFTVL
jgi:hypothetical protein